MHGALRAFLRKGRHGAALQRFHGGLVGGKANPFEFPYPKPLHDDGQKPLRLHRLVLIKRGQYPHPKTADEPPAPYLV